MKPFHAPAFEPQHVPTRKLSYVKTLMRQGWDLDEAALAISVRSRDLDIACWRTLGNLQEGWE